MPAYVLHMDTNSFAETDSYIPERWLPDISMDALSKLSSALCLLQGLYAWHLRPTQLCCTI